jgi:excisionase family DNA binding protein
MSIFSHWSSFSVLGGIHGFLLFPYPAYVGLRYSTSPVDKSRFRTTDTATSQPFLGFEPYIAAEEAAEFLKVTARRIKDMARAGSIPAHPVDPGAERKEWRFLLSELAEWMQRNARRKA